MKNERDIDTYEKTFSHINKETFGLDNDILVNHSEIEVNCFILFRKKKF
jgi:hypothetical protein